MKHINSIQLVNYKAFYDSTTIDVKGKNILLYGENGSGKTSLYEAIKQFFRSSFIDSDEIPARHIRVPKTYKENEGTVDERELQSEVLVKILFADKDGSNPDEKIFGIPTTTTSHSSFIREAALLNGFLSYRELLQTYLMDNLKDRYEFRKKFALLLIEGILARTQNSGTQETYIKSWKKMYIPRARYKDELMTKFKQGLSFDIDNINLIINSILHYFDPELDVELILIDAYIDYYHNEKADRDGKYPYCEIDLNIKIGGNEINSDDVNDEEENHLTVLNEARLSALAISIYLASITNIPQNEFQYKILFLDDIFIGLDMGNRVPLLEILTQYKKPIIEDEVDESGKIVRKIRVENESIITEEKVFFSDYQLFMSTYDRYWFQVAKDFFKMKEDDKWNFLELYAHKTESLEFTVPLVLTSLTYLEKASFYLDKGHDYAACSNYLRKALEKRLKDLLPDNELYIEKKDDETGMTEIKKINLLHQYIDKFISYCKNNHIDCQEYNELKLLKDWYLNPFSHDNISTPIYKRELERAILLIDKLYRFSTKIVLMAGSKLYFEFLNDTGDTRRYEIELQENMRYISSNEGNIINNPDCKCTRWVTDGIDQDITRWTNSKVKRLYKNKSNAFFENSDDFSDSFFLENLFILESGNPISSLI